MSRILLAVIALFTLNWCGRKSSSPPSAPPRKTHHPALPRLPLPKKSDHTAVCVERTGFRLGDCPARLLRFSSDCKKVSLIKGNFHMELNAVSVLDPRIRDMCASHEAANVVLLLSDEQEDLASELLKLNPDAKIQLSVPPTRVSYLDHTGAGAIRIPILMAGKDEFDPAVRHVEFEDAMMMEVQLTPQSTCEHEGDLRHFANSFKARKRLISWITREFAIRL